MVPVKRPRPVPLVILRGHANPVSTTHFLNHPNEPHRYLATGDESGSIRLWDTLYEECLAVRISEDVSPILSIIQDVSDTSRIVVQQKNGRICSVDLHYNPFAPDEDAWQVGQSFSMISPGHRRGVLGEGFFRIAYVGQGILAGGGCDDGAAVVLQDERTGFKIVQKLSADKDNGLVMCLSPVHKSDDVSSPHRILVGYENRCVGLWDLRMHCMVSKTSVGNGSVLSVASSPRGRVAVMCGSFDHVTAVADLEGNDMNVVAEAGLKESGVGHIVWGNDGRFIATAGWDGAVRVWDGRRRDGLLLQSVVSLRWHEGSVQSLAMSSDGALLASGGKDGTIALWDNKF